MGKSDRSVVRNAAYKKAEFSIRERHNERLNETYYNADIETDRKHLNIYFKQSEGSYAETFEKMLTDGTISTRGLKADAKVFDELVFDVNTEYFDRNGGYEYAKSFFEEAYRCAVKEIGGEQYVLSAVMHADERNKALSEERGHDVYHYHLHVVYVPVVDKDILWTKRCKDPALVGTVKETIKQVSHSKKWPRFKTDKGWVNSYSLLQDRYHDHMKNAGYIGFERGERGSTAEHLSTEEYKAQKERERAAVYAAVAEEKSKKSATLDKAIENKRAKLNDLAEKIATEDKTVADYEEIEALGHKRGLFGGITVNEKTWEKILNLVKEAFNSRDIIAWLHTKVKESAPRIAELEKEVAKQKRARESEKAGIKDVMEYSMAKARAPHRLAATIADIKQKPPEQHTDRAITKKKGLEI